MYIGWIRGMGYHLGLMGSRRHYLGLLGSYMMELLELGVQPNRQTKAVNINRDMVLAN